MANFTIDKVLLISVFFVPGFIYLKSYRLFIADIKTDFSKDFYEALGFSFINAILFSYPIYYITHNGFIKNRPVIFFLTFFIIVVIAPIVWALLYYMFSKKKWFSRFMINPTKSAWDSFFSRREACFVIITLKNGHKIGGKYGLDSYSSTFPNPKEIYLEEVWKLNENQDGFIDKVLQTYGVLITDGEISTIDFFI